MEYGGESRLLLVVHVGRTQSCVQIFELIREKYTGRRIVRHGSWFSSARVSNDHDNNHARRVSSLSSSSYSAVETHRHMPQTVVSTVLSRMPSSSSLGEGITIANPRPPTPVPEEVAEGVPGESADKKTSYDVTCASPVCDEVFVPPCHLSETRRPSILKLIPSTRSLEDKRGLHHVQFTEAKHPT